MDSEDKEVFSPEEQKQLDKLIEVFNPENEKTKIRKVVIRKVNTTDFSKLIKAKDSKPFFKKGLYLIPAFTATVLLLILIGSIYKSPDGDQVQEKNTNNTKKQVNLKSPDLILHNETAKQDAVKIKPDSPPVVKKKHRHRRAVVGLPYKKDESYLRKSNPVTP